MRLLLTIGLNELNDTSATCAELIVCERGQWSPRPLTMFLPLASSLAGALKERLEFLLEAIRFKESSPEQVEHLIEVFGSRDLPYTTNLITGELIEGHSDRANEAGREWEMKSKTFPKAEREWRWLEFLIQKTGTITQVGQQVDVLQFTRTGHSKWLQRRACEKLSQRRADTRRTTPAAHFEAQDSLSLLSFVFDVNVC